MRFAIISDIHANLPALRRAAEELALCGFDRCVCLGDLVGYGAWPNECCELLREMGCVFVRGNHDEAAVSPGKERWFTSGARACIVWTREVLTEDNRAFLESLTPLAVVDGLTFCHGSVTDPDYYTTTPLEAMGSLTASQTDLTFLGHTHYAEWYALSRGAPIPEHVPSAEGQTLKLDRRRSYLINPGSVGQPRDGNPQPGFAIYDFASATVELRRFAYDVAEAQRGILDAGMPLQMADRLAWGI